MKERVVNDSDVKREYPRVDHQFDVRLVAMRDGKGRNAEEIETIRSVNVSASGLLVNTRVPLESNLQVSVTFIKPNSFDIFNSAGEVIRSVQNDDETYSVAIKFVGLTPEAQRRLDYYVKRQ